MPQPQQARRGRVADQKDVRLAIRASMEQKALIERAAALEGRSVSGYVLAHVLPVAERTIQEHQVIMLSAQDVLCFLWRSVLL